MGLMCRRACSGRGAPCRQDDLLIAHRVIHPDRGAQPGVAPRPAPTGDAEGPQCGTTVAITMTSREIAELTGKRHDNVMRDIEKMLDELGLDHLSFEGVYLAGNGEQRPLFSLPRRECLILVSGYSVEMRAKIIDRWQELEDRYGRGADEAAAAGTLSAILWALATTGSASRPG